MSKEQQEIIREKAVSAPRPTPNSHFERGLFTEEDRVWHLDTHIPPFTAESSAPFCPVSPDYTASQNKLVSQDKKVQKVEPSPNRQTSEVLSGMHRSILTIERWDGTPVFGIVKF